MKPTPMGCSLGWSDTVVCVGGKDRKCIGVKRSVLLTIPFFVPVIYAIAHSDLVLTIPRKLAKITRGIMGVKVVEPPRELKAFPYFMAWHSRLTGEPAHSWFREQIRQAVASL